MSVNGLSEEARSALKASEAKRCLEAAKVQAPAESHIVRFLRAFDVRK